LYETVDLDVAEFILLKSLYKSRNYSSYSLQPKHRGNKNGDKRLKIN